MNTMKWLIKREFWEHKGGLFWAPMIVGALLSTLITVTVIVLMVNGDNTRLTINGETQTGNTVAAKLAQHMSPERQDAAIASVAQGYMGFSGPLVAVLAFVLFFFCLNALFDERKDRSVLFWKSLPVSDAETVISKVVTAVVAAPLIALAFAFASALMSVLVVTTAASMFGVGSLLSLLGSPAFYYSPLLVLAMLPVFAIWALPTVGWLMLVGAWAKTKPFLWAVGAPLLVGGLTAWINRMFSLGWDMSWFWKHVVGRALLSIVPGSWFGMNRISDSHGLVAGARNVNVGEMLSQSWQQFGSINIWIGALLGCAMIYAAIRVRRWRDDG